MLSWESEGGRKWVVALGWADGEDEGDDLHLLTPEDQTLLNWRNPLLLLHFLLDLRHLLAHQPSVPCGRGGPAATYLVGRLDVQLDLLPRERSDLD